MEITQHKEYSGIENHKGSSSSVFIRPKLSINTPGDVQEQEADTMADKVMRMKSPQQTDAFFKPAFTSIQRKCAAYEEEGHVHRKENSNSETHGSNELDNYVSTLSSSGQSLPESSRSFFEPRVGQDFSNVKIHTDSVAAKSAQSINALAYTTGNNIVFNQGQYSTNTESGQRLMAHELTHVVQQGRKPIQPMVQRDPMQPNQQNANMSEAEEQQRLRCNIKRTEPGFRMFNLCPPEIKTDVDDTIVQGLINTYLSKNNNNYEKAQKDLQQTEIENVQDPSKCGCCNYNLTAADHYLLIRANPYNALLSAVYTPFKAAHISFTTGTCPTSRFSLGVSNWENIAYQAPQLECEKKCENLPAVSKAGCFMACNPQHSRI